MPPLMKRLRFALVAIALLASGAAVAYAGPFGVEMGADISSLRHCQSLDNKGYYRCSTLPNPHSSFDYYVVQYHPSTGACWVKGVGKDIQTNVYGASLRSEIDKLYQQISSHYGKGEKIDLLMPGSIWNEPQDWTMAVLQKDRFYGYEWKKLDNKGHLKSIYLGVSATRSNVGFVFIEFAFTNEEQCESAINSDQSHAF
jgi:hypothetical protein